MQFKPEKTPHRVFVTLRYLTESFVNRNTLMFAYPQCLRVHISYFGTGANQYFFDEYSQGKQHRFLQFDESIVRHSIRGQIGKMPTDGLCLKVF